MTGAAVASGPVTSLAETPELAQSPAATVTSTAGGKSAAERKREQRDRERRAKLPTFFDRADWSLFTNPRTLLQKAGCQPQDLRRLVLRELVDNALDAGANAIVENLGKDWYAVSDDGPGIDPDDVPRIFSVNRSLISSKQIRLPTRGMVGNGCRVIMGAVAAFDGFLVVDNRGRRLVLDVDRATGMTNIVKDDAVPMHPGMRVHINLGSDGYDYGSLAQETVRIADYGSSYEGVTSPHWYDARDLHDLMVQAPAKTTVADVAGWFAIENHDLRIARDLSVQDSRELLATLRTFVGPVQPDKLGEVGEDAYEEHFYHKFVGFTRTTAEIPYVVEAWATCRRSEQRGAGSARAQLLLNKTISVSRLHVSSNPHGLYIQGCGMNRTVDGKTGHYYIVVSVLSPYIALATDGKEPALSPFSEGIVAAVAKACARAHNAMDKPPGSMTIVAAAEQVMTAAYLKASANGTLPANARQIMYAARPRILELTERKQLIDSYFTQSILPDYIESHPDSSEWDVVFDDRGTFTEPHTGRSIGLGTIAVRQYLGERPSPPAPASINPGLMSATIGPENRYIDALFIEKEGFNALAAHALIAERFDLAITSSKGMTNTALRQLIDGLISRGMKRVFVLHDFDASGFSIFGTLGTDSRRYKFTNKVEVIDLGMRLSDVRDMKLDAEPHQPTFWNKRKDTLRRHGASLEEIDFLEYQRVELNAMASDVFIKFLEHKLEEYGVKKVVPDIATLNAHARDITVRQLTNRRLEVLREEVARDALAVQLPDDLQQQVATALADNPEQPWDLAVAEIIRARS